MCTRLENDKLSSREKNLVGKLSFGFVYTILYCIIN